MAKNILLDNVQMDTQTAFFVNGDIKVYPCSYEQDKAPITSDPKVSYKGRITVMEDGNTNVMAYNIGSQGPRYKELFATERMAEASLNDGSSRRSYPSIGFGKYEDASNPLWKPSF